MRPAPSRPHKLSLSGQAPAFILCLAVATVWSEQRCEAQATAEGYIFTGAGSYFNGNAGKTFWPLVEFGGGGDALIQQRFGIGGELHLASVNESGWGALSVKASVHFPRSSIRNTPFLSGGYTLLLTGESAGSGINVGGGITHWFDAIGVRLELSDVVFKSVDTNQYWAVRAGIVFR